LKRGLMRRAILQHMHPDRDSLESHCIDCFYVVLHSEQGAYSHPQFLLSGPLLSNGEFEMIMEQINMLSSDSEP
jgi:hypothetical protein